MDRSGADLSFSSVFTPCLVCHAFWYLLTPSSTWPQNLNGCLVLKKLLVKGKNQRVHWCVKSKGSHRIAFYPMQFHKFWWNSIFHQDKQNKTCWCMIAQFPSRLKVISGIWDFLLFIQLTSMLQLSSIIGILNWMISCCLNDLHLSMYCFLFAESLLLLN